MKPGSAPSECPCELMPPPQLNPPVLRSTMLSVKSTCSVQPMVMQFHRKPFQALSVNKELRQGDLISGIVCCGQFELKIGD